MRYHLAWPVAGAVLAALASGAAAAAPSQLAQAVTVPAAVPASPDPSSSTNVLTGVSATSASNAWAVGYYRNNTTGAFDTLILHWNGTGWKQAAAPSPGRRFNSLYAVSATSATNAWAVGTYHSRTIPGTTLILHWNGIAWSQVKSPNPSSYDNELLGVSAVSGTDAWAAGQYYNTTTQAYDTLLLHWNGTAWKQVSSPNPSSSSNHLYGVWATSASSAWAVGQYPNNTTGEPDTLALHWNGTAWKQAATPNPSPGTQDANTLNGVAGTSASNIWAAGFYNTGANTSKTLILHWNGTAWKQASSPSPARLTNTLSGIAATSASNAWAAGQYTNNTTGVDDTLILHWNGTSWAQAKTPNPSTAANDLSAVSTTSAANAWAVGWYENTSTSAGASDTLILHWNGVSWSKT